MEQASWGDQGSQPSKRRPSFPAADLVSLETIVNILLRKGICTPEELFEEEQNRRKDMEATQNISPVQISDARYYNGNGSRKKAKSNWLKRRMSKYRWSRRLGTWLFGWKWKKVRINKEVVQLGNQPE